MQINIEDNFDDVLRKSAVGQRLGHGALAVRSNLSIQEVRALLSGDFNEKHLRAIGSVLKLDADKLVSMAKAEWYPEIQQIKGLEFINTPFPAAAYEGASVNCCIVTVPQTSEAILFDTGACPETVLNYLTTHQLSLKALFLTHTHRDHVAAYDAILEATGCAQVYAPELEPYQDATAVRAGEVLQFRALSVEARLTNGHSRGGMTYVLSGLEKSVAVVGDSLFCLSQGGTQQGYRAALKNNREQILSLPAETVLCPGHGPMTTVGEELAHNPFF
ncbi:MAG: MBL fold metallo-hydrolase [Opitutaceae bacterium]